MGTLNTISNPNFRSFTNFERLYDYVLSQIGTITGISNVEVYDVSLYLGERMTPQIVPSDYVYVHGKLGTVGKCLTFPNKLISNVLNISFDI